MLHKLFQKEKPRRTKRGRNKELVRLRNEAMFRRFVYWSEMKRLRLDDVLEKLSREEFFLDEKRIVQIIRENSDRINEIRDEGKGRNQLKLFE